MKFSQITTKAAPAGTDTFIGVDASGADFRSPLSAVMPSGAVIPFAGSAAPSGFLLCSGQAVSRTTYAALFAAIASVYGAGDGSTTFNVPDLRGREPVGAGTGSYAEAFATTAVNTSTDQITLSAGGVKRLPTAMAVVYSTTGTAIGGLVNGTTYYIIPIDSTHIQLATNQQNAGKSGPAFTAVPIDLTSVGTGTHTLTATLSVRAAGDYGGEETHFMSANEQATMYTHKEGGDFVNFDSGSGLGGWDMNTGSTNNGQFRGVANGGFQGHNNMNPFVVLNYIIKI